MTGLPDGTEGVIVTSPVGSELSAAVYVAVDPSHTVTSLPDRTTPLAPFTLTSIVCVAEALEPPASLAHTLTVAEPRPAGINVICEPETVDPAADGAEDRARYVNASPSASENAAARSTTWFPSPTWSATGENEPTACGGSLSTVTSNLCRALVFEPPASLAVTSIVAVPGPFTPVTVTVEPERATVATDPSVDDAAYVSVSPSPSMNALASATCVVPASFKERSANVPEGSGERFDPTVTRKVCVADLPEPPASVAVTVIVELPDATGVRATDEPETDTVTADSLEDVAVHVMTPLLRKNGATSTDNTSAGSPSPGAFTALSSSGRRLLGPVSASMPSSDVAPVEPESSQDPRRSQALAMRPA